MAHNRLVNSALSELQEANRSPIYGYQHLPVLTLQAATEKLIPLVPGVVDYVSEAKKQCNRSSTLLTWDESAAIYLYSMPIPFFYPLNEALRAVDRHALEPWFAFLKLFMTALEKLPSNKGTVWRGIAYDDTLTFVDNDEHIWWSVNSCSMNLNVVKPFLGDKGTLFAIDAVHGKDISAFSANPDEEEVALMPGTCVRAKGESLVYDDHLSIVHLQEENSLRYVFELIKHEYQRHSRIERIMNPSKSFPIQQSYINLAIIETKEQQEKEKKLLKANNHSNQIIGTFEEIYSVKTKIEIEDIFKRCKDSTKKILVLGRAGIGKTTFCRYIVYQWATGAIWQEYQLVIFIRLRNLTESRYPPLAQGTRYSLIDLVETEYFYHGLSEECERLLKEELNKSQVLWLLDGCDEIVQNIPPHLKYLLEQLLKTPHHILTSRPYLNTLSYNVQLEITGFTDDDIKEYVKQFFDQIKDEICDASLETRKLLDFLKSNPRIWGIVHIPVNLELMCSLWCNTDWSEITTLTMTPVYDKMIEWLCRRHLDKHNISSNQMTKEDVYTHLHKELAFLESLAFNAMQNKSIILHPKLLRIASKDSQCSLQHQPSLLNIGILKSLDYNPIGTSIEADKNHYFLHLSFQEHFAARYLVKSLNSTLDQKKKAINFININKYTRRFESVLIFASALVTDSDDKQSINLFWETLLGEPLDLIGLRHIQIIISCLEEARCTTTIPHYRESMDFIIKWITYTISGKLYYPHHLLTDLIQRSPTLVNQPEILDAFKKLSNHTTPHIREYASSLICELPILNSYFDLIQLHLTALNGNNNELRTAACQALGKIGEKAATNEVIHGLLLLLDDTDSWVKTSACHALQEMGEKAAANEVINRLLLLFRDTDKWVTSNAYKALEKMSETTAINEIANALLPLLGDTHQLAGNLAYQLLARMGEKVATNKVINRLLHLLDDTDSSVRSSACEALGAMGEKAATNQVINRLLPLFRDTNDSVRHSACYTLRKIAEKAATSEVINSLLLLLGHTNGLVRNSVCEALGEMGAKAITNEVINALLLLLGDSDCSVRSSAYAALWKVGEKAATNEVLNRLLHLLDDTNNSVRSSACEALEKMGEKAATSEVINRLLLLLGDTDSSVRSSACHTLPKMGEQAATNEVINRLLHLLDDIDSCVRSSACRALEKMGRKAATNEVINRLLLLLDDTNDSVRSSAYAALGTIGEKPVTNGMINRLLLLFGHTNHRVRDSAYEALTEMGEKVATDEVVNRLLFLLGDASYSVRSSAYEALEKMGAKAITNDVINRLLLLLGDRNYCVRSSAYTALWKMGEKAATNEVLNRLLHLLHDTDSSVRSSACYALEKMGEKAATNEVLNRLLHLLDDTNNSVRNSACEALGEMGEKAATKEVTNRLLCLLDDINGLVRSSACHALRKMGEKAATNEVMNRLLHLLDDTNKSVRSSACHALEEMGEKAVTSKVINRLLVLLDDRNDSVRSSAYAALGKIGEKRVTDGMINKLLLLLGDTDSSVRSSACYALEKMGEKAATNQVINRLLSLLDDTNDSVRSGACAALGRMGEKAVTSEVINRLLLLLGDTDSSVRSSACYALEKMGEKAATNEVINRLLSLLHETNDSVRSDAYAALERMGEKAVTSEVINGLLLLLGDSNDSIRSSAYQALWKMGEKAADNDVINRVSLLLGDTNDAVRGSALEALKKMGKKAATDEVIAALLDVCEQSRFTGESIIENMFYLLPCMSELKVNTVEKLSEYMSKRGFLCLENIPVEKFIGAFLDTQIFSWLPIIKYVVFGRGYAITVTGMKIVAHGNEELVEIPFSNIELCQQLQKYFLTKMDEWRCQTVMTPSRRVAGRRFPRVLRKLCFCSKT